MVNVACGVPDLIFDAIFIFCKQTGPRGQKGPQGPFGGQGEKGEAGDQGIGGRTGPPGKEQQENTYWTIVR